MPRPAVMLVTGIAEKERWTTETQRKEARPLNRPSLQVEAIRALGGHGDACARCMAPALNVGRGGFSRSDGLPHPGWSWARVGATMRRSAAPPTIAPARTSTPRSRRTYRRRERGNILNSQHTALDRGSEIGCGIWIDDAERDTVVAGAEQQKPRESDR
jgi:hypothetical protein